MAHSQRLAALLALQSALQGISVAGGYNYTVKAASVVLDPVSLETVNSTELPFFCFGGPEPLDRAWEAARRVKDKIKITLFARVDAPGTDLSRKTTAFENLVADIEKAIGANIHLGGVALDTRMGQPDAPAMGLGQTNIVILQAPIDIWLQQRVYGAP